MVFIFSMSKRQEKYDKSDVPNVLVQVKVTQEMSDDLTDLMKEAGDIHMATFVRRVLHEYIRDRKVAHGKK